MRTVLIVDDDKLLREAIGHDFKRKQFKVLLAENGNQAFQIVQNEKIDIVLSDVRMPNGNGVDLLKNIRAYSIETPVVFLITGFADLSLEDAYHEGAAAVIAKPFNRKHLNEAIQNALLPKHDRWTNVSGNPQGNLHAKLNFTTLKEAMEGHVLSIGQGGMFVATDNNLKVPIGSEIEFHLSFQSPSDVTIIGRGILRWTRPELNNGMPKGFGIEFLYIDDLYKDQLIKTIDLLAPKSFIPKY